MAANIDYTQPITNDKDVNYILGVTKDNDTDYIQPDINDNDNNNAQQVINDNDIDYLQPVANGSDRALSTTNDESDYLEPSLTGSISFFKASDDCSNYLKPVIGIEPSHVERPNKNMIYHELNIGDDGYLEVTSGIGNIQGGITDNHNDQSQATSEGSHYHKLNSFTDTDSRNYSTLIAADKKLRQVIK